MIATSETKTLPPFTKRNTFVLVLAQAFLGAQLAIIFIVAGLAGKSMTPHPCLATAPLFVIVLTTMFAAPMLSNIMQKYGRRIGFWIGASAGLIGGALGAYGLVQDSFTIFLVASFFSGLYQSSQGFFRFAATDNVPDDFKAKAISWVLAGGLASAIIGPQLVNVTAEMFVVPFLGAYYAVMVLNMIGLILFGFLKIPNMSPIKDCHSSNSRSYSALLSSPQITVAIITAMVSYALMSLVMTSTPLAVVGCGFAQSDASNIVSAHVFAMFLPSFFTGHLIQKFGVIRIICSGLILLMSAGIIALLGVELHNFYTALILLGFGWNFGFIGATALLSQSHNEQERGRVQGLNDMIVFGGVSLASLASGGLMNCSNRDAVYGWSLVNIAMIPCLILAALSLLYLVRYQKLQNN